MLPDVATKANSLRCLFQSERVEKVNGSYDADRLKRFESQEVEVLRDDEVRLAGESAGEDVIVGRVFFDNVWNDSRDNADDDELPF